MEKCRVCNTEIPDGSKYCTECESKEQFKSNESYLDDLLSAVMSSPDPSMLKNSNIDQGEGLVSDLHSKTSEEADEDEFITGLPLDVDIDDLQDFDQFNIMEDLEDVDELMDLSNGLGMSEEIEINDEDLFGPVLDTETIDDTIDNGLFNENVIKSEIDQMNENDSEDIALFDIINELDQTNAETVEYSNNIGDIKLTEEADDPMNMEDDRLNNIANGQDDSNEKQGLNDLGLDEEGIDEDILSLLSQMSDDDPIAAGIANLIKGTDEMEQEDIPSFTTDVGEVFSDALSAVTLLNDNTPDSEQANLVFDIDIEEKKKLKKEKLKKLMVQPEEEQVMNSNETNKEKKGLFSKIFAKKKDKADKKAEKMQEKNVDRDSNEINDLEFTIKAESNKDKKKSSKKVSKKAKKKTKALQARQANGSENKENADSKQAGKKVSKKASSKQKKVKKKRTKKVKKEVQEVEIDLGKVNPVAASFVMVTFALLALFLLSGSKAFAYSNSIKNATHYFNSQRYTKAYEELHGMEIKIEDVEIFNKIQTVMYVNKQLNSYNNYYAVAKHPEALDSLLKGLKRYDKYIELAIMYGIESDLDYVRGQILAELDSKYNLSEDKAMQMIAIEDEAEYSKQIYETINNIEKDK